MICVSWEQLLICQVTKALADLGANNCGLHSGVNCISCSWKALRKLCENHRTRFCFPGNTLQVFGGEVGGGGSGNGHQARVKCVFLDKGVWVCFGMKNIYEALGCKNSVPGWLALGTG